MIGMLSNRGVWLAILLLAAAGCGRFRSGGGPPELSDQIRAHLAVARPAFVTADADGRRIWKSTRDFYAARSYAAAWIDGRSPRPQMDALIEALRASAAEGLDPDLYGVTLIESRRREAARGFLTSKGFQAEEAGGLDVWLTYLYLKFASDLADGLSDLARADSSWQIRPERFDARAHLEAALRDNRVAESLRDLTPHAPQYEQLRTALATYRALAGRGGWPGVPEGTKIRPGDSGRSVGAIARRLAASGEYRGTVPAERAAMIYSTDLQEAVRRFQRLHGLEADAVVGRDVVMEMNVPIADRIQQIELNLERWRWLPRDLGDRYILVNIPAYRMDVWERGRVPLSMRVVVGKKDSPTPIFTDVMTYVVFSPYWNVPPDIARDETLPSLLKDASFLEHANMEIVDRSGRVVDPRSVNLEETNTFRFRQRPGGSNSLGLVKFMFPNQFNVYLHDTPADALFERAGRSLSHGCVRVEQPQKLAEYVLRDQPQWTPERIAEAMHGEEEKTVKLKAPLPVYLGYWTAAATSEGVQFTRDVYGIDARQSQMLADRLARMRKSASAAPLGLPAATPAPKATPRRSAPAKGKPSTSAGAAR
jgi:murein L,D-transpeptidase YcbB/YkuD